MTDYSSEIAPPPPPPPSPKRAAKIAQIALIVASSAIVPVIIVAVVAASGGPKNAFALGEATGRVVCFYAGIAGLSAMVHRAFRSRSGWPATIVFVVLMLTFAGFLGAGFIHARASAESARLWREMGEANEIMFAKADEVIKRSATPEEFRVIVAEQTERLARIGESGRGEDALLAKVAARSMRDFLTHIGDYHATLASFPGLEPRFLKDKDAVTRARAALRSAADEHQKIVDMLARLPQLLDEHARACGASNAEAERVCNSLLPHMNPERMRSIHGLEHRMLQRMDDYLAVLEQASPHWKVADGQFIFDPSLGNKTVDEFNAIVADIQSLVDKQRHLQSELVESKRKSPQP